MFSSFLSKWLKLTRLSISSFLSKWLAGNPKSHICWLRPTNPNSRSWLTSLVLMKCDKFFPCFCRCTHRNIDFSCLFNRKNVITIQISIIITLFWLIWSQIEHCLVSNQPIEVTTTSTFRFSFTKVNFCINTSIYKSLSLRDDRV